MIEEYLNSRTGVIFISIVWGLGLATLFKRSCDEPGCHIIKYTGPRIADTKYAWKYTDNKCYNFEPYLSDCGK